MSVRVACEKVKRGIENGIYPVIRLIQKERGKDVVLIPNNKIGKENCLAKLNHIRHKLENDLPPGKYFIKCQTGMSKQSIHDEFPIEVHKPIKITSNGKPKSTSTSIEERIEDHTQSGEEMQNISLEEYIRIIKENEALKSMVQLQQIQLDAKPETPLADKEEKSPWEPIMQGLKDAAPTIGSILEKFLEQRDRIITLKEKSFEGGKVAIKKNTVNPVWIKTCNEVGELMELDENKALDYMDVLAEEDPAMYDYICDKLGLEPGEEEEEEQQEE